MQSRLEQYLDEVSRPMPASERIEWRSEAEQHLTALIEAYEELGHSREEATELALAKFGEAGDLGERMQCESLKSTPMPAALKFATGMWLFGGAQCLLVTGLTLFALRNPFLPVLGLLSLLVAGGFILRLSIARKGALVWSWAQALSLIPLSIGVLSADVPREVMARPLCGAALAFGTAAFQIWILTRPQIRALFDKSTASPPKRARL